MGFLTGKKILVTGIISNRSIAFGIAKAMHREGAELAFTYQNEKVKERLQKIVEEFNTDLLFPCDVAEDSQLDDLYTELSKRWDSLDSVVHSIAYAPKEAISGDFIEGISRENFRIAHDISSYSLLGLTKALLPLLEKGTNPSVMTLTYLGSERILPNYNMMGLAKASLEAGVRYLASSLGSKNIRVNAISPGPIKTLAAAGIGGFSKILNEVERVAPLHRNVTIDEVGNICAFMASDLSTAVTGEIIYVDGGFNTVAGGGFDA